MTTLSARLNYFKCGTCSLFITEYLNVNKLYQACCVFNIPAYDKDVNQSGGMLYM